MRTRQVAALVALGVGVAACSGPTVDGPTTTDNPGESRDQVDARSYFDNYPAGSEPHAVSSAPLGAGDSAVEYDASEAGEVSPYPHPDPHPVPEPGFLDDNTFVDHGDSAWTATQDQQTSTFGLDVDTGSFSIARAFLEEGHLPEPDSIRVEEWVNSFNYDDPAPTDAALGVSLETAPSPRGEDGTRLIRVGVSTEEMTAQERPRANITFVVDVSGSMNIRERLGLVQASLALLANNLRDDDTVSIVVYGTEAEVLLAPTEVSDTDVIVEAIDSMVIGGATNMQAGLELGYDQAREGFDEDAVNVVVLASDGVANIGSTDPGGLTDQIAEAGSDGIHLVTVGFGMGNYNDHLMEQLANLGDGFYSYVDTFEEAERLFVDELTPTLAVVAYDTKVQVAFDPEVVESYRLIGYQNRLLDEQDFTDDSVDAGELGAGHQVSALYEVRPADGTAQGEVLGTVGLRWIDRDADEAVQIDSDITLEDAEASDALRLAALVADSAEVLKGTGPVADRGISLDDLLTEATELDTRGVDGAAEMLTLIEAAIAAEG